MKMDTPLVQEKPKSWKKSVVLTVILVFAMCAFAGKEMIGSRELAVGEPDSKVGAAKKGGRRGGAGGGAAVPAAAACQPDGEIKILQLSGTVLCGFGSGTAFRIVHDLSLQTYMALNPAAQVIVNRFVSMDDDTYVSGNPMPDGSYTMVLAPGRPAPAPRGAVEGEMEGTCTSWCADQGLRPDVSSNGKPCRTIETTAAEGRTPGCNQRACMCK